MNGANERAHAELLMGGFVFFQYLHSAGRLGLFSHLEKKPGSSLDEVAVALALPVHSARVLLLGCSSMGVVNREDGRYYNSGRAAVFDARSGSGVFDILNAFHTLIYPAMFRLHDSLVAGTNVGLEELPGRGGTLYERLADSPELADAFNRWMACIGHGGLRNEHILGVIGPTLQRSSHVLDCGGGDGRNAISLCRAFPHLRVTVFDLPSQCESAAVNVEAAGLSDRISLHSGDFRKDPLPLGPDTVLFSHVVSLGSEASNRSLLKKTLESLRRNPGGGTVVIYNAFSNPDETGSLGAATLSAYFLCLATGEGMVYPVEDCHAWLRDAGFEQVVEHPIPGKDKSFIVGIASGDPVSEAPARPGEEKPQTTARRIGVLGTGTAGQALGSALVDAGYRVCMGSRSSDNPRAVEWARSAGERASHGTFADAAAFGQLLLNCTAGRHSIAALHLADPTNLAGKILIDLANPLDVQPGRPPRLSVCNDDSLGEQIQREFPEVRVVKTLNTMNRNVMVEPRRVPGEHQVFISGDDPGAKEEVTKLLTECFGWPEASTIDLGDISSARYTEMVVPLWIRLRSTFGTPDFNFHVAGAPQRV